VQSSSSEIRRCVNYDPTTNIIAITCDTNLSGIYKDLNNREILQKNPNGVWTLNASIEVNPQAKLTVNKSDTSWIKITNNNASKPNYISISGSANIDGVKITSWDPISNDTIKQNVNGSVPRPYIMAIKAAGNMNISNSEIAFLGYNKYPSNGLVYERGGNSSNIINNTFHDMWDGFYSDRGEFITIKDNVYHDNKRYGIDPHSRSHDIKIIGNLAYNNSIGGITCSDNCYNILFANNTVHNNGEGGIMFSLQTTNSTAVKNFAYNERVGISIYSSSNNKVFENTLKSNDKGISIGGKSFNNHIFNNRFETNEIGIDFPDQAKNNVVENNTISVKSTL
jgi:parallel beta-helix repeat protein